MTQRVFTIPITSRRGPTPRWARIALAVAGGVACLAGLAALFPFWMPLVLAAWVATLAKPLHRLLCKRSHHRRGSAALVTVMLVVAFLTPLLIATLSLSSAAIELGQRLLQTKDGTEALRSLAASDAKSPLDFSHLGVRQIVDLARQHGSSAFTMAKSLFGAATLVAIGAVVFVSAFYTFLTEGSRLHEWLLVHSPLERGHFHRLSSVFDEVGRGLLVGVGLTAVLQGVAATIGYVALGVPQPLVLGLVTVFASLIPSVGSGLVWGPVTAGLFISGRPGAAVAMLVIGCVVSLVDNVMHPVLAKYGQLRMHGLLLFMAMLGGLAAFGPGGLIIGPLCVRLAIEALTMLRESEPNAFPAS
jgi:predicted PurR-regulated permease PerM